MTDRQVAATDREESLVELVDEAGRAVGTATVRGAHTAPGLLHRAFSVMLFDPDGRVLIQRRAMAKTRFALRWANTCCGHPLPGQPVEAAASIRLGEEIGLRWSDLTEAGTFTYSAVDPFTDRVERELDHVLTGLVPTDVRMSPDPGEVAELRWVDPAQLGVEVLRHQERYAPWLGPVLDIARRARARG